MLGCVGIQAIPPGPTTIVVNTPLIVVVIVEGPVNVVNEASVEAVKVTSEVLELSMAVIVITVLVGAWADVCAVVRLGVTLVESGPGAAVVEGTMVGVTRWPGGHTVKMTPSVVNAVGSLNFAIYRTT